MRSATVLRTFFVSLLAVGISFGQAFAQEAPRRTTSPSTGTKDGSARVPGPGIPLPVPDKAPAPTTQRNPAPVYRPAPQQQEQTTVDRNYDTNRDGVISKAERKRMKEIRKADKKRAKELRKSRKAQWKEDHKHARAAHGLEERRDAVKKHNAHDHDHDDRDDD